MSGKGWTHDAIERVLDAWVSTFGSSEHEAREALRQPRICMLLPQVKFPAVSLGHVLRALADEPSPFRGYVVRGRRPDAGEAHFWSIEKQGALIEEVEAAAFIEDAHVAPFAFVPARDDLLGPEWAAFVRSFERAARPR